MYLWCVKHYAWFSHGGLHYIFLCQIFHQCAVLPISSALFLFNSCMIKLTLFIFPSLSNYVSSLIAFAEELLNKCIQSYTLNDSLQRVYTEKKDCLFTLDFQPIEGSDFDKESHPLTLMVSCNIITVFMLVLIDLIVDTKKIWESLNVYCNMFTVAMHLSGLQETMSNTCGNVHFLWLFHLLKLKKLCLKNVNSCMLFS